MSSPPRVLPRLTIIIATCITTVASAQTAVRVNIQTDSLNRLQEMDGFGTTTSDTDLLYNFSTNELNPAYVNSYYDDMMCSALRIDLTPAFLEPYKEWRYNSPNFDSPGEEGNYARAYDGPTGERDPGDPINQPGGYTRPFSPAEGVTWQAPIAVFGPNLDDNISRYVDYSNRLWRINTAMASAGKDRKQALGDFKLVGSVWSGPPWLKVQSGNRVGAYSFENGPASNTPYPFIWIGQFSGGKLDTTGEPRTAFDDSQLPGGSGPTSALTQFARYLATYIRAFQIQSGARFHAISIQNELNFEAFFNSTTYPLARDYLATVKAVRAEFDRHDDLRDVQIMGPEDLLAGGIYGMWQYGVDPNPIHKNLHYMNAAHNSDPIADQAIELFSIHGYAWEGMYGPGARPTEWDWWAFGWDDSPASGIPGHVKGFRELPDKTGQQRKSWMTETSYETASWIWPAAPAYPNEGAWSLALRVHQALTSGYQSGWLYWKFTEDAGWPDATPWALTNNQFATDQPKYIAVKHFFRYIRPGSYRYAAESPVSTLLASAYGHEADRTLTVVLLNATPDPVQAQVDVSGPFAGAASYEVFTSSDGQLWQPSTTPTNDRRATVQVPGYGVVTLVGSGALATASEPPKLSRVVSRKRHQ